MVLNKTFVGETGSYNPKAFSLGQEKTHSILIFHFSIIADSTMVAMSLPADYGYVIMTGVGAIFMVMWKGIRVGKARKEHGVQYPDMYSSDNKVDLKTLAFPSRNNSVPRCSTVSSEPIRTPWRTCLSSCSSSPWVGQSHLPPS